MMLVVMYSGLLPHQTLKVISIFLPTKSERASSSRPLAMGKSIFMEFMPTTLPDWSLKLSMGS